jgi:hypothetical protein
MTKSEKENLSTALKNLTAEEIAELKTEIDWLYMPVKSVFRKISDAVFNDSSIIYRDQIKDEVRAFINK